MSAPPGIGSNRILRGAARRRSGADVTRMRINVIRLEDIAVASDTRNSKMAMLIDWDHRRRLTITNKWRATVAPRNRVGLSWGARDVAPVVWPGRSSRATAARSSANVLLSV